jgi:hypothetical protein
MAVWRCPARLVGAPLRARRVVRCPRAAGPQNAPVDSLRAPGAVGAGDVPPAPSPEGTEPLPSGRTGPVPRDHGWKGARRQGRGDAPPDSYASH